MGKGRSIWGLGSTEKYSVFSIVAYKGPSHSGEPFPDKIERRFSDPILASTQKCADRMSASQGRHQGTGIVPARADCTSKSFPSCYVKWRFGETACLVQSSIESV